MKNVLIIVTAVIGFASAFYTVRYYGDNPYEKHISWTKQSLSCIRQDISLVNEKHGRYAATLSELKQLLSDMSEEYEAESFKNRNYVEYISVEEGTESETTQLDNRGGWYYNPKSGEVKVNLTEPLHTYFPHYYYFDRNEIPSEWQHRW